MKRTLLATVAMLCTSVCAANAQNAPVKGWSFVDPVNGNDGSCATQLSKDGAITPVPTLTVTPCKTFTRACAILPADAGGWVVEGFPGSDVENAVCNASGDDAINDLQIIGRNPGAGNAGPLYLKSANMTPAFEITGHDVYINKIIFEGSPGDALYVHGKDSYHLAEDVVVGYNTTFDKNGGYAIHSNLTYWFLTFTSNIFNNGANLGTQGCVLIENSTFWLMQNTGITNCGATSGTPPTPKPGMVASKTNYGQWIGNTAMHGAYPNLQLNDSFSVVAVRDSTKPAEQPVAVQVNSAKGATERAYELSLDQFFGVQVVP
jgi:hypothetical protein